MAKMKRTTFADRLRNVLENGLATAGIDAKVDIEKIQGTRLHRVLVVSPQFDRLRPSERQNLVWRILKEVGNFTVEDQLRISMITTVTPQDVGV